MYGQLHFVGCWSELLPGCVVDRVFSIEFGRERGEVGGVCCSWSEWVANEKSDHSSFIDFTSERQGERAVGLAENGGSDVREVGSYLFRLLVRGGKHAGGIETSLSLR